MKLSIITPLFNRADCVVRCLESVTAQIDRTAMEIEHVVVDDGSTDNSAAVLGEYAATHPHVKPIYFPTNRGVNAARNAAIRAAEGEYVLLVDSDDRLAPDALAETERALKAHPGFRHLMFAIDDRSEEMDRLYGADSEHEFSFSDSLKGHATGDFAHVVHREAMLRHPYDEQLRIFEGFTMMLINRDLGRMIFINRVLTLIERDRPDSVTLTTVRRNDGTIRRKLRYATLMLDEFADDYRRFGLDAEIERLLFQAADNSLLLGDYKSARKFIAAMRPSRRRTMLSAIAATRTAGLYKAMLTMYLRIKHRQPARGVK